MYKTNWKRLVGIVIATIAIFCLFDSLFFNSIVVWLKGSPFSIDTSNLDVAVISAVVAFFAMILIIIGTKKSTKDSSPSTCRKTLTDANTDHTSVTD